MASDTYSFDILGAVSNGRGEEGDARAEERPTVKRSGYSRHIFLCTDVHWKKCACFPMGEQVGVRVNTVLDPKSRTIYVRRY